MAISAIQPISGFNQIVAESTLPVRRRVTLVEQAPQIALPGVRVTLGASQPLPVLFNSAGLLRSLIQVESTNDLPSGPLPGSDEARSQGDLSVLLGLNTDTTNSGIVSATGSTATPSADTLQALNNLLANRFGEAGSSERSQAESDLLSQLLSASSSGLNSATAAATVLNASGLLQGATADTSSKAVDSLLTTDLGLAAKALGTSSANADALATPILLQNAQSSPTGFALDSILATNVKLATAASNVSSLSLANLDTSTSSAVKDNILRSSLNLSGGSGGLLTGGSLLDTASSAAQLPSIAPEAVTRALAELSREVLADELTPTINLGAVVVAAPADSANPTRAPQVVVAQPGDSSVVNPADATSTESPNPGNDPGATAIKTVTGNPAYAEAAAALYLSAAIYRSQPLPGKVSRPDEAADNPAVSRVQNVLRLKARG